MVLRATDAPMDSDTVVDTLSEAAAATAWMSELSLASSVMLSAEIPVVPLLRSPSM